MSPIIETRDLVARYADGPIVLDTVNLSIEAGSRTVLLGANGSGKTTLLRCLCGSHKPSSGQILVNGKALVHNRAGLREHRRQVQLVLQDPDEQLFSADVRQDISFGPTNMGLTRSEILDRVDEALTLLSITHLADRPCHQLSYGERKRVAIAGAIAMRPAVLLLDEPTAGLDPQGVQEMIEVLSRLREIGTTVVLSTHEVDLAMSQADQIGIVNGHHVYIGETVEMLSQVDLVDRARLKQPWQLALATRLGWSEYPRDIDSVVDYLSRERG